MLVGDGNPGPFFGNEDSYRGHRDWRAQVVRFAERTEKNDIVILKRPHHQQWQIQAVGQVTGDYDYLEQFDDVEGWGLQHCRTVDWVCPREKVFTDGLSMGAFKRVYKREAIDKAKQVLEEGRKQKTTEIIPQHAEKISDEDLVESLIGNGLRPADAETVIRAIGQVRRLARWYAHYGRSISEHETRTFLIVPILLALGWSEQKMKIEWNKLDIAFFPDVYGGKTTPPCIMILESKRMGEGLSYAERQVKRYSNEFPECERLIVSDGNRYRLYIKGKGDLEWNMERDFKAYMNLLNLKDRHPYLADIGGAPDLFISLMPK